MDYPVLDALSPGFQVALPQLVAMWLAIAARSLQ
jgi:hypothetical protein